MKGSVLKISLSYLLLIGLSFSFGRLFEIFFWNSNVVKIENVVQISQKDELSSYNYIALNELYWQDKACESEVIPAGFTSQYLLLNRKVKSNYITFINRFIAFKPLLLQRFVFNVIYVDEDFS